MKTIAQLIGPDTNLIYINDCKSISITNKEELIKCKAVDVWIINLHLNWDNNHSQNNYGLDIGVYIRKDLKSKAPIVFLTPIYEVNLFAISNEKSKTDFKYNLLYKWQTHIINYPYKKNSLNLFNSKTLENISENYLSSIIKSIFDYKAMIEKYTHDFKNDPSGYSKYNDYLIHLIDKKNIDQYETAYNNLIEEEVTPSRIENFKNTILQYAIQPDEFKDNNKDKKDVLWEILYLDDQDFFLNKFSNLFNDYGIKCNKAKNETEAIKILKKNKNIEVFISDLMLYDSFGREMRPGNEVIQKNVKTKLACYILTSNKSAIIESKSESLSIKWKEKNSVNFNDFVQEIKQDVLNNIKTRNKYDLLEGFYTPSDSKRNYSYFDLYNCIDFTKKRNNNSITIENEICEFVNKKLKDNDEVYPSGGTTFQKSTIELTSDIFIDKVLKYRRLFLYKLMTLSSSDFSNYLNTKNMNSDGKQKSYINRLLSLQTDFDVLKKDIENNILGVGKMKILSEEINYLKKLKLNPSNTSQETNHLNKIHNHFKTIKNILQEKVDSQEYSDAIDAIDLYISKNKDLKIKNQYEYIVSLEDDGTEEYFFLHITNFYYLLYKIKEIDSNYISNCDDNVKNEFEELNKIISNN